MITIRPLFSIRFQRSIMITRHAQMRMLEREVDAGLLQEVIDSGEVRRKMGSDTIKKGDNRHTQTYTHDMKPFRWNHEKNEALKVERGISFEVIALAIEADGLLDILRHPNAEKYPNQSVLVVALDAYVYLVPYVEEPDYYFLKTVIPSRKATRDYLLRSNPDEET